MIIPVSPARAARTGRGQSLIASISRGLAEAMPFRVVDCLGVAKLRRSNLVEQFGMTIQYPQQFHQRQWRFGFASLIAGKSVYPASKNFGSLPLIERELFAN